MKQWGMGGIFEKWNADKLTSILKVSSLSLFLYSHMYMDFLLKSTLLKQTCAKETKFLTPPHKNYKMQLQELKAE